MGDETKEGGRICMAALFFYDSATFVLIDMRRADVRRETAQFRPAAWEGICAVAMGYGPWAMGYGL